jgi:hypothetical protein
MTMPGFTAQAALDRAGGHYCASGAIDPSSGLVAPQLIRGPVAICGPCKHGVRRCHACITHPPFSCTFFELRC